jgi:hypothetical protein
MFAMPGVFGSLDQNAIGEDDRGEDDQRASRLLQEVLILTGWSSPLCVMRHSDQNL